MTRSHPLLLALLFACSARGGDDEAATSGTSGESESSTSTSGEGESSTSESSTSETSTSETSTSETGEPPGNPFTSDEFLVIAHRGGGLLRPEETLPAFEHALAVGADVIEMDVHASLDGTIVLMHDDSVDRTTDGTGAVAAMTFAELRMLDAGYEFTPDDGRTYPYRGMGIVIPTLDEVLDAFPDAYYLIEIKQSEPPIVDAVLASLAAHEVGDRVVIASFDDATIEAVRAASPATFTALSAPEMAEFFERIDDPTYQPPCAFLQSPWEVTSQEVVDRAHALGLKVHPWTVNGALTMGDLIARGVDGIMSDDPALLVEVAP